MKIYILLISCVIFLFSIARSQESKYSFKENYKLSLPTKLTVSSHVGAINVSPSESGEIEVLYIATKNNKIISINKDDIQKEGIILKVKHDKNSLDLSVKYPVNYFHLDFSNQIHVNFEIHVPKETDCDLITDDGNISIQGLKSDQECTTDDGDIKIFEVTGNTTIKKSDSNIEIFEVIGNITIKASDSNIKLSKINGSISVNASDAIINVEEIKGSVYIRASDESMFLKNINGKEVQCRTSEGNIELINVNGEITAKTSEGHIQFTNLSGSINAYTMAGNVKGNIQKLKKPITIEAGSGDIDISIDTKLGLNLNIRGKRANTPKENFWGSSNKYFMKGEVNGGGITVNLLSIDGKIKIAYK